MALEPGAKECTKGNHKIQDDFTWQLDFPTRLPWLSGDGCHGLHALCGSASKDAGQTSQPTQQANF